MGFSRNPLDPPLAVLAVVDGSPPSCSRKPANDGAGCRRPSTSRNYCRTMPASTYRRRTSSTSTSYTQAPGLDPSLPLLRAVPEGVEVAGTALFAGGRMVGRIGPSEGTLLLAMMGRLRRSDYFNAGIGADGEQGVSVEIIKARRGIEARAGRGACRPSSLISE